MSKETMQEESARALQARIDNLCTRLILSGVDDALPDELRRLGEAAQQSGCPETARAAMMLAGEANNFSTCKEAEPEAEAKIRQGLVALLKVLDTENSAVTMPLPPADSAASLSPSSNALSEDPELVGEFVTESREHLASIETQMLVLEQTPGAIDAIHTVFRGFHTIKGLAGFLEFAAIQTMAHEVETLLDLARNEKLSITPQVVDLILESADYLKEAMDAVENSISGKQPKPVRDTATLLLRIRKYTVEQTLTAEALPIDAPQQQFDLSPAPAAMETGAPAAPDVQVRSAPVSHPSSQQVKEPKPASKSVRPGNESAKSGDSFSVRVETAKLDHLMEMVGEMVIAQSMLRHSPALTAAQDPTLSANISQLARITTEVQRTAMAMRMVQVGQLFQRSARMVRDLSRKLNKEVIFEISGEDTELDKTIAEELSDPLLHMVRNAIDHGVESPEKRRAAGKNPTACVRLAAYHKAGQIVIEIGDDGQGLAREKILNKAREKGLITDGSQLTDSEVFHLIFEPGFSTAEQITDISGRGVGMDVVRKNIQKMRGRVEIHSKIGEGTTFFLKLPLTLAIIEGLVVVVGEHRYVVPLFAVKEMFRATPDLLSTVRNREEMALVRGKLLPIVRLARRLNVPPRSQDACDGLLVVAECEGKQFCLLVDDLIGKQEIVIKSLGESLKNIHGIAGCAILGDGRVSLILDVESIYRGHA